MEDDQLFTEKEAARRCRVSDRTLQHWRYQGFGGPAYVRIGLRRVAYRASDLSAWLEARRFVSRAAEMANDAS
jgi:predicted DNA-binding transcriptional regulator AlpA